MKPTRPELPKEFVAVRKRRRIMDAIAELTAEEGYEATKIADIVRRAGVARKTLYDNFDGKEEVFLAAFQVLLHGYSGQADIVVGAPIANRNRLETEGLIGCLINALALRGDLSGDPPFLELLARVRDMVLAAHTHEDLPFDKLVEELNPERGDGQTPFFQVVLSYGTPRQPLVVPTSMYSMKRST